MKNNMKCLMAIILFVITVTEADLPSYIKPCKRSDPKFQECALQRGREALPFIVKGDKSIKLIPLDPFTIPEIKIETSGLHIKLKDAKLKGLSLMQLKDLKFDGDKQFLNLEFLCTRFDLNGTYNVSGQLLVLPITGHGDLQITLFNTTVKYGFTFNLTSKEGKEYVVPNAPYVVLSPKKSVFNVENLFNGDQTLGHEMNKFFNENQDVMIQELAPSVSQTVSALADDIVKKILTPFPLDELILP